MKNLESEMTWHEWLELKGWKRGFLSIIDTCDFVWHKRFPKVKPRCRTNSDKAGILLTLKGWDNREDGDPVGFELSLIAEPKDGIWVNFTVYTLTEENLKERLDSQVTKLIKAWVAINS